MMVPSQAHRTGRVMERMVREALEANKVPYRMQQVIGCRPNGTRHRVDFLIRDRILVSTKWQQSSGTAEQKIPYEVICLAHAVRSSGGRYSKAYLVLGGKGWTLNHYYLTSAFLQWIPDAVGVVEILLQDDFVGMINSGKI